MKNNKGITLTELVMVFAIIGVLAVALGFQFQGWMGAYRDEQQLRDLLGDMTSARAQAMSRNRMYFMQSVTPWTAYSVYDDDSSGAAALTDGDEVLQTVGARPDTLRTELSKTTRNPLTWGVGTDLGSIRFHRNGWIDTTAAGAAGPWTIRLNSTSNPDYDCIQLTNLKINIGIWNGTTNVCDVR